MTDGGDDTAGGGSGARPGGDPGPDSGQPPVDGAFVRRVARELVAIESVNPSLDPSGSGEAEVAEYTAEVLDGLGLEVERHEPVEGRVSVTGRLPGSGGGRSLMLNAHYDTVAVEGMEAPFAAEVREGRLHGRGAYDMKGSLAACLGALRALCDADVELAGDVWVAAVADEEHASLGTRDLLERMRPDGAVVTEPTDLRLCVAHKGFLWAAVETEGRAAHGSRPDVGEDANLRMGRVLGALADLEDELRSRPEHPLLGRPSLHVGTLRGGSGISTYAAGCRAGVERRTLPGETVEEAAAELAEALARAEEAHGVAARLRRILAREPFETSADAPLARTAAGALEAEGLDPSPAGEGPWTDAALLAAAGVDTVVVGPSGRGAHAAEEWVELESLETLARALVRTATDYCGPSRPPPPDTSGRTGS